MPKFFKKLKQLERFLAETDGKEVVHPIFVPVEYPLMERKAIKKNLVFKKKKKDFRKHI